MHKCARNLSRPLHTASINVQKARRFEAKGPVYAPRGCTEEGTEARFVDGRIVHIVDGRWRASGVWETHTPHYVYSIGRGYFSGVLLFQGYIRVMHAKYLCITTEISNEGIWLSLSLSKHVYFLYTYFLWSRRGPPCVFLSLPINTCPECLEKGSA